MRKYGKVIEYDGYCGTILGINGMKYLLLNQDLVCKGIKEGDIVTFFEEEVMTSNGNKKVARFIDIVK